MCVCEQRRGRKRGRGYWWEQNVDLNVSVGGSVTGVGRSGQGGAEQYLSRL